MQIDPVPLIAFLIGIATGAAGQYFADKYSDRRRKKEAEKRTRQTFRDIADKMPALLKEMKDDLATDSMNLVREFFVLPSKGVSVGGSSKRRFTYFETEHEALREKLDLLAHAGFITDVSPGNTPIFRMEEFFVHFLQKEVKHG